MNKSSSSWIGAVGLRLLGRRGAQIGLAWIGAVALLAVFAPLLASSHPILWKEKGAWSSPLWTHLSFVDGLLLALFLAAAAWLLARRLSPRARLIAAAAVLAAGLPLAAFKARPPENADFPYRAALARDASREHPLVFAVFAPVPYSFNDHLRDFPQSMSNLPPSGDHWLGTEGSGADVLSHMIHACRMAMAIGLISTGIALCIGILAGGLMGYLAGWVDLVGMRLVDIVAAVPTITLLIMICAFYERNIYLMMAILGLFNWVGYAVFIRAEFLRLRNADFVQAARAVGAPHWRILLCHMLPNGITPVLTLASFGVAGAILTESTLSFLGLGLPPGDPSWGQLLDMARKGAGLQWWLVVFPGAAIFLTVFAYNLVGEAMQSALDPKAER